MPQTEATNVRLAVRVSELGLKGFTPAEVEFIYETMRDLQPDLICEWGTNVGHSARILHEARKLLKLHCELHSIDIAPEVPSLRASEKGLARGHYVRRCRRVYLHVGDGAETAYLITKRVQPDRPLFFIDDNHEEEEVFNELTFLAARFPNAVMLVHDAMLGRSEEPDRALRRFLERNDNYDVYSLMSGQSIVRLWPKALRA